MIHGIGIDMVELERIEKDLERFGDTFAKKILHENELKEFQQSKSRPAFVGKRFAAKEAFLKALGTGLRHGLSLKHIEVCHDEEGKPLMNCYHKAADFIKDKQIERIHLSITDEQHYASAVVLLEK